MRSHEPIARTSSRCAAQRLSRAACRAARGALALAAVAAICAATVACSPSATPDPTQASSPLPTATVEPTVTPAPLTLKIGPPSEGAYVGVFRPPAPFDIGSLKEYERFTDKSPAILMWFQPWDASGINELDPALLVSTWQRGAVPLITWEPWNPGGDPGYLKNPSKQPNYQLKDILAGRYDDYIRSWARDIKKVGGPVMLRPMHEMNGSWYPWCGTVNGNEPSEFVDAWRHMHDIFTEEGVENVTWVWSINQESVPRNSENKYAVYYPGDEYVDWTSVSGFNWGTSREGMSWREFDEIYTAPLKYLRTVGKPVVLSEFGSVPDGGDKAAWIVDSYDRIRTDHPEIAAVVYYDKYEKGLKQVQKWQIDSSAKSVKAYGDALSSGHFIGAPIPELRAWANSLTADQWAELRAIPPLY